jgi:hypothetical protein
MNATFVSAGVAVALALCVLMVATSTIKIAREYERGVVFRLGRLIDLEGPGLFFIFPFGIGQRGRDPIDRPYPRIKASKAGFSRYEKRLEIPRMSHGDFESQRNTGNRRP